MTKLSLLVTIALSGIGTWRDFDSLYLCLVLNALALVLSVLAEKLGCLEVWWLGVFIAPTTKVAVERGWCRRAHQTLSSAPATSPSRWGSTIGALTSGATGQSGAPSAPALTSTRAVAHCSPFADDRWRCSRYSAWHTGQSGATADSTVNYSGEPFSETQSLVVGGDSPWCTGHYPVVHRIVRCARPGQPSVSLLLFI
jgi:hypothetical protein